MTCSTDMLFCASGWDFRSVVKLTDHCAGFVTFLSGFGHHCVARRRNHTHHFFLTGKPATQTILLDFFGTLEVRNKLVLPLQSFPS
jgi:hypothetical protein